MKAQHYGSESGYALTFLSRDEHKFSLTLYLNGIPVLHHEYSYYEKHHAEHDRDALVGLGHMVELVAVRTEAPEVEEVG